MPLHTQKKVQTENIIQNVVLIDSLHYARTCSTYLSEANQLIQHIIVQDQDGQNNNIQVSDIWCYNTRK